MFYLFVTVISLIYFSSRIYLESFCCWLKNTIPPIEDYYLEGASVAGVVHRKHYRSPPTGMRSAVPLGGLAAGSFEMRADGERSRYFVI